LVHWLLMDGTVGTVRRTGLARLFFAVPNVTTRLSRASVPMFIVGLLLASVCRALKD